MITPRTKTPDPAHQNQIVATPTLAKALPAPSQRFVGDLVNLAGLFADLRTMNTSKVKR
jgi:hypothetical protein